MDRLSVLLQRFAIQAGVFHVGRICGVHHFERDARCGHVHLIKRGPARLSGGAQGGQLIEEPTLVFMPRPEAHQLITGEHEGADVVCANIRFGVGGANPITDSLPSVVQVRLADLPGSAALLALLDEEAFTPSSGRQAALDRLCEVLLIRLVRHCMERGLTQGGTLAGLADPRLSKALAAMHERPEVDWGLESMAAQAGMSRARFAVRFREVVGCTPGEHLAAWRVTVAQGLLRAGRPMRLAALDVGYGSASAFTRAFSRHVGLSPSAWLKRQRAQVG